MSTTASAASPWQAFLPYVRMARLDHCVKNAFMLLGVLLAYFYEPALLTAERLPVIALAFLATWLVASSNYVVNELVDAPLDRFHPEKKDRPAAVGQVKGWIAVSEWLALGALGLGIAYSINTPIGLAASALWVMGCVYNVRPLRSKDIPYVDVLSESLNNPIRLLLGWHVVVADRVPPVSLVLAYWMLGAFFMAAKRLGEYRRLADPELAGRYRRSFRHYNEERLLSSMMFYVACFALFTGIFIVRYKLELILMVPLGAAFVAYYLRLALRADSPVQHPERLHRERLFLFYSASIVGMLVLLMFSEIPVLYALFNVEHSKFHPLWRIGR